MTTNVQCPECNGKVDIDSVLAEFSASNGFAARGQIVRCRDCTNLLVLVQTRVVLFLVALAIVAAVLMFLLKRIGVNEILAGIGAFGPAGYAAFYAHEWFSTLRVAGADDLKKSPYQPAKD